MAKLQRHDRLAKNHRGDAVMEQNLSIDDYFLPSASELEKLKEIDGEIITWIMARAEHEQSARIQWNHKQNEFIEFDLKKTHRFNFTALIFTFLLFVVIICAAMLCIVKGLNVEGTILGGVSIVTGIISFLSVAIRKGKKFVKYD